MIGYILAIFVGISLGLIGAGGSILTVPILVYVMKMDAITATGYSLFVVGLTSLVGASRYFIKKQIDIRTAFLFGVPSILSAIITRTWIVPVIPSVFFHAGHFYFTKNIFLLLLFAVVMIIASLNMIRPQTKIHVEKWPGLPLIFITGIIVGLLTGLVGAGGGFLIIPSLVLFLHLPIKKAIGTSLLIITMNTLFSFAGGLSHTSIDWRFLLIFTFLSILGIFIGFGLSSRIEASKLKPVFGWFVLAMGICIIIRELFLYKPGL
jgi:uncharacterized membrane protein YfcA